jgi:parallel beta-helix repeat protein
VEVARGSEVRLLRNRIYGGKLHGIYLHEDSRGIIEDNLIHDTPRAGAPYRIAL